MAAPLVTHSASGLPILHQSKAAKLALAVSWMQAMLALSSHSIMESHLDPVNSLEHVPGVQPPSKKHHNPKPQGVRAAPLATCFASEKSSTSRTCRVPACGQCPQKPQPHGVALLII